MAPRHVGPYLPCVWVSYTDNYTDARKASGRLPGPWDSQTKMTASSQALVGSLRAHSTLPTLFPV